MTGNGFGARYPQKLSFYLSAEMGDGGTVLPDNYFSKIEFVGQ